MDNVESWLLLKSVKGIGNKLLYKAFRHFGSAEAILKADKMSLEPFFGSKAKNILSKDFDKDYVNSAVVKLKQLNVEAITYENEIYPINILNLPDPPPVIFLKGDKSLLSQKSVSVVGSRKAVASALNMTKYVVCELRQTIVSGGADGIDSKAHQSALENSIPTVAVLGFGFLYAKNTLFTNILNKNGLLLTEFLPFEKPSKYTFPMRNRIIASLGEYLLVMQASAKSGALISAYWAFKLNKKVFAYVGNPVEEFEGCVNLIRENVAKLFTSKSHLFKDLDLSFEKPENQKHPILSCLDRPCTFDELLAKTNYDEEKLTMELAMLEIEGYISKDGAYFVKNA
ncbi:MAG: DNA-processing protein DprA [Hydrogenobaculum sp.]